MERGGAGEEIEGLEDEADLVVADAGQLVVVELGDVVAVEPVAALRWASRGSRGDSSGWTCRSRTGP